MSVILLLIATAAFCLPGRCEESGENAEPLILEMDIVEKILSGKPVRLEGEVIQKADDLYLRLDQKSDGYLLRIPAFRKKDVELGVNRIVGIIVLSEERDSIRLIDVIDADKVIQIEQESVVELIRNVVGLTEMIDKGATEKDWIGSLAKIKIVLMAQVAYYKTNRPWLYDEAVDSKRPRILAEPFDEEGK